MATCDKKREIKALPQKHLKRRILNFITMVRFEQTSIEFVFLLILILNNVSANEFVYSMTLNQNSDLLENGRLYRLL
jgi:hypothetical protein